MIRRLATLLLLLLAAPAGAEDGVAAGAARDGIAGTWTGHYTCAQGNTAMALTITPMGGSRVTALFHFEAAADNPEVPTGCYEMVGDYDAMRGRLRLSPWRWLMRPPFYVMVALDGRLAPDGTLAGEVRGPGCTSFAVTRAARPADPEACRRGGPLLSLR